MPGPKETKWESSSLLSSLYPSLGSEVMKANKVQRPNIHWWPTVCQGFWFFTSFKSFFSTRDCYVLLHHVSLFYQRCCTPKKLGPRSGCPKPIITLTSLPPWEEYFHSNFQPSQRSSSFQILAYKASSACQSPSTGTRMAHAPGYHWLESGCCLRTDPQDSTYSGCFQSNSFVLCKLSLV